tara:strand:- start:5803 stop:6693 length:891 start_codon:yes stop_codon:yes gene_type:complete
MKNLLPTLLICLLYAAISQAQTTDLARIEYMNIPFSKSKNSISRFRALAQLPIPLDDEKNKFLVVGLEYRYIDIDIKDPVPMGFNPDIVNSVQRIEGYLGYTFNVSENWRFGIRGGARINSNLQEKIGSDDIIYTAAVYMINDMKDASETKPYRWIFGLNYSTTPGRNYPLPLVNYYREFHPNWTYTLGVPKTNVRHYLNDDHKDALQAFVTLDNFFSNIQQNAVIDNKLAENISMTIVLSGLGYEHFFTEHLLYYAYATHSIYNDFRLRDNDRNTIYTFNDDNTFYFRTGVKFKF